jgi:hypothetical protein
MANKNFLQKLWIELTRVRRVEFISYETEEEENERLEFEFKKRIKELKDFHYQKTMEILISFQREIELAKTGINKSDLQLLPQAEAMFLEGRQNGRIDEFNRLTEVA